jgi:four helix bundle protein
MPVTDYSQLETWQRAMDLAVAVHVATRAYPKDELYTLVSQTRRSAVSVPSNIAEGQGRGSSREFVRFLAISRGSLSELETQILLAERFGYLDAAAARGLIEQTKTVGRLLNGLIRSVAPPADR